MATPLIQTLREVATPPLEGVGYELVDLEWKREQGVGWVFRVFIDRLQNSVRPTPDAPGGLGGITHEDCTIASRELSAVLDVADVLPHAYHLEVSSPGVDRPLRTQEHFRRFAGQRAKVRLRHGLDGRKNFAGTIVDVIADDPAGRVVLEVDGTPFTLPLDDLDRANLVYDPKDASRQGSRQESRKESR